MIAARADSKQCASRSHSQVLVSMVDLGGKATFAIDRSKFTGGGQARMFRIDPRTGKSVSVGEDTNSSVRPFSTPDGWEDALLVLESPRGEPR